MCRIMGGWIGRRFNAGLIYTDRQQITLTFTPTGNLELPFKLWEAAGAHGWSPRRHKGGDMQTATKTDSRWWIQSFF